MKDGFRKENPRKPKAVLNAMMQEDDDNENNYIKLK